VVIGGTAAIPNIAVNFPADLQSVSLGTVSNTAPVGAGTLTIDNTTPTAPTISVNFPATSSMTVKDANGISLGLFAGYAGSGMIAIEKNGYILYVYLDGTFPVSYGGQISFSSPNTSCGGTPFLFDGNGGGVLFSNKTPIWSGNKDLWYVVSGPGSANKGMYTSGASGFPATADQESSLAIPSASSFSCIQNQTQAPSGWVLTEFNPQTTLGWPSFSTCSVTGGTVSCLAGPLQLP
jgi:hypothetical protein